MAAGSHPDHDTLAAFRRRCLDEWATLFVPGLELATEMTLLKLGPISLDGTKVPATAARHSALSQGSISNSHFGELIRFRVAGEPAQSFAA